MVKLYNVNIYSIRSLWDLVNNLLTGKESQKKKTLL